MRTKSFVVLTLIVLLMAGIAYAKEYEIAKKTGEYNVAVRIDKNPPIVGENSMSIEITDASGHYARDAKVIVEYSMPAMPGMPAMNYKANAELKGDGYNAKMNLSMAGSWNIAVKISRADKTFTMKFIVDAT